MGASFDPEREYTVNAKGFWGHLREFGGVQLTFDYDRFEQAVQEELDYTGREI